jgi:hypothetical protein
MQNSNWNDRKSIECKSMERKRNNRNPAVKLIYPEDGDKLLRGFE